MRKKKSTQQLVGIESVTDSSVLTAGGELTFYLVQPTNLNVLPESGVRTRVTALLNVLKASAEMELLALDAKESYQDNRLYYRRRAEEEGNPAINVSAERSGRKTVWRGKRRHAPIPHTALWRAARNITSA